MLCNSVERNPNSHHESFSVMNLLFADVQTSQARTAQSKSFRYCTWQDQVTQQVHEKNEFDDYIFAFTTEVNGKTISGKTIRTKCDKKQKSDTVFRKN